MLSIGGGWMGVQLLILAAILVLLMSLVGVPAAYLSDFVTVRRSLQNWTLTDEEASGDAREGVRKATGNHFEAMSTIVAQDYYDWEGNYKLRFRPITPQVPRIFWDKFPQQQQVEVPSTTVESLTTQSPVAVPTEPPPTIIPTTTTTTTTPPPMTSTRSMWTPVAWPSSTSTTIMNGFAPPLGGILKQLLLYGSPVEANLLQKQPNAPKSKSKGFLSLFEVIKFENNKCSVDMGDIRTMEGVCYHEFECKSLGGIPTQQCAEGVGVCCIFLTGCGDVTNQPIVYFESPNYPNAVRETMICVLIVNLRNNVQQLRLDFLMFELNRPSNGDCVEDQFIISGQNLNFAVPVLCGINTGQHIYVHAGHSFDSKIYLSFFAKVPTGGRSFNIKITQVESDLAPDGCLQYYTATEGVLKSFNYDIVGTIVDNREATYLNNLNYAICLIRAKEMCSVLYSVEQLSGDQPDFQITNKDEDANDLVPDGQAGAGIFNCPDDFIAINQVRLCGERFNDGTQNEDFTLNAPVKDIAAGPMVLPFRSDAEFVGRGFRLVYKQELCV